MKKKSKKKPPLAGSTCKKRFYTALKTKGSFSRVKYIFDGCRCEFCIYSNNAVNQRHRGHVFLMDLENV